MRKDSQMTRGSLIRVANATIAILLTLSLAIFPISGTHAAAVMGHHHGVVLDQAPEGVHGADHNATEAVDYATHESTSATHDCSSDNNAPHTTGGCCDMGACHAFALGGIAAVAAPAALRGNLVSQGDEQVRGERSFRIDRPPRPA